MQSFLDDDHDHSIYRICSLSKNNVPVVVAMQTCSAIQNYVRVIY